MKAERYNEGKVQHRTPDSFPHALEGVALNGAYGASKYAQWNYMKGAPALEHYEASRRHQLKWFNGQDWVPDAVAAGFMVHEIDAAIWNLMRLREEIEVKPPGFVDDRPVGYRRPREAARVPTQEIDPEAADKNVGYCVVRKHDMGGWVADIGSGLAIHAGSKAAVLAFARLRLGLSSVEFSEGVAYILRNGEISACPGLKP